MRQGEHGRRGSSKNDKSRRPDHEIPKHSTLQFKVLVAVRTNKREFGCTIPIAGAG